MPRAVGLDLGIKRRPVVFVAYTGVVALDDVYQFAPFKDVLEVVLYQDDQRRYLEEGTDDRSENLGKESAALDSKGARRLDGFNRLGYLLKQSLNRGFVLQNTLQQILNLANLRLKALDDEVTALGKAFRLIGHAVYLLDGVAHRLQVGL